MNVPKTLSTILVCTVLTLEGTVAAAAAVGDGSPTTATGSANVAGPNQAENGQRAPERTELTAGPQGVRPVARTPAATHDHRSAAPQRDSARLSSANAERLRALLNARAHGHVARPPGRSISRPVLATADSGKGIRGPSGTDRQPRPYPAPDVMLRPARATSRPAFVASGADSPGPANFSAFPRPVRPAATIGGPSPARHGFVGGPAIGPTAHNSRFDPVQLRRPR